MIFLKWSFLQTICLQIKYIHTYIHTYIRFYILLLKISNIHAWIPSCPDGITPNSGLTGPKIRFYIYIYRNTEVKVRSPDGDTEYFDIVAGVLQGHTLAPYLFIIYLDDVFRTSIDKIRENGFELTKKRSRRHPAKTITDADYADDMAILANTPNQAETLLHSFERAAAGIGFHVNAHKTEYMCYNQTGDITTLDGTPLKLVNKFTYIGSSVSSTEKDIDTRLTKA